jgi:DNA-binding NarL/FixJ family response regulator
MGFFRTLLGNNDDVLCRPLHGAFPILLWRWLDHADEADSRNIWVLGEIQRLFVLAHFRRFVVMEGASGVDSVLIRIIVADSQAVYRVGLIEVLSSKIDMRVVAQANTLEGVHRAVEHFLSQSPTQGVPPRALILLASNMLSGTVDAISQLVRRAPQAKIITQLDKEDESSVVELYHRGVRGVIPRSVSPDLLVKCIRNIAAGETWIDNQSVDRLIGAYRAQRTETTTPRSQPHLSLKELAIITCTMKGNRNKEIARQLGATEQMIKNYLLTVYRKLGVSDRFKPANYVLHHQLHKEVSRSGFLQSASAHVPDIQGKPNGVSKV